MVNTDYYILSHTISKTSRIIGQVFAVNRGCLSLPHSFGVMNSTRFDIDNCRQFFDVNLPSTFWSDRARRFEKKFAECDNVFLQNFSLNSIVYSYLLVKFLSCLFFSCLFATSYEPLIGVTHECDRTDRRTDILIANAGHHYIVRPIK